jgi:hypothetical protein
MRENSDERYIIDLCDKVLGKKARRQHRFTFLVGDPDKRGRCHKLPVDAYYEEIGLVVEFMERQHSEDTPFFDKRMTLSGVPRGKQRRLYDERRAAVLPKHRITLVGLSLADFSNRSGRRLLRQRERDEEIVREKLAPVLSNGCLVTTTLSSPGSTWIDPAIQRSPINSTDSTQRLD